jgi:hypothetical protein
MAAATSASAVGSTRRATQPGSAGPPLPVYQPTERDCYLYEAVQIEGLSSRQAAQRFGISQTRVQQIRRQMTEWLAVIAGPETGLSPAERICAGIDLAERRCNYLYSEAMEAWRASQEPQVSTRLGPGGHELKTTTLKSGDPRYLWMAMRMNTQMVHILGMAKKLLGDDFAPLFGPGDQALLNEPEVTGKRTRRAGGDAADGETSDPPVGDCSPQAAEQGAAAGGLENASDVSPVEPTRSEVREARRQAMIAAYHRELETVQQAEEAEREQARQTVAAILKAEQEREEMGARQTSLAKDRAAGDRDEPDERPVFSEVVCRPHRRRRTTAKGTEIYKFEKIKRAKRKALADNPERQRCWISASAKNDDGSPEPCVRSGWPRRSSRRTAAMDNGIAAFKEAAAAVHAAQLRRGTRSGHEVNHCIGSKTALAMLPACFINPGDVTLMTVPGYPVAGTHTRYYGGSRLPPAAVGRERFLPDLDGIPADAASGPSCWC